MRAAIMTTVGAPLTIENLEVTPPGKGEVTVRSLASSVCHSDEAARTGIFPMAMDDPWVLGHEGFGVVEEIGPDVLRLRVGDRVVLSALQSCGQCFFCVNNDPQLCTLSTMGDWPARFRRDDGSNVRNFADVGTFAEYITVPEQTAIAVETSLPPEQLAPIGCALITGVGAAVNTAKIVPGSSVAVVGCGGVGQSVIQGAKLCGAAQIIAIDLLPGKRESALRAGATHVIDPSEDGDGDPVARVMELTGGRGADYAFEVIGIATTMRQVYDMTRRGGMAVVIGLPRPEEVLEIPGWMIPTGAKTLVGSYFGSSNIHRDIPKIVALAEAGSIDLSLYVSSVIDLADINTAFDAMHSGANVVRTVVRF